MKHETLVTALAALSAALLVAVGATAQTTAPGTHSATAELTAKIVAIDYDTRVVTLQDSKGNVQSVTAGPEVKRFSALKVGDTITFRYEESVATAIVKPGTATPAAAGTPTVTRTAGEKPGGTVSQTMTTTVTIQSIDTTTPAITVKTQDGRIVSFAVSDKKNLTGLKAGDVVQITYTQALMISVK